MRSAIKRCCKNTKSTNSLRYRRRPTPALKLSVRKYFDRKTHFIRLTSCQQPCPQKSGRCIALLVISPKKPNSAQRRAVRVRLNNRRFVTCYIPGEGRSHNLQRESKVLVRGGRTQDLPGVRYKVIRGKLDCYFIAYRLTSRSKYGTKRWQRAVTLRTRRAKVGVF